ncbi:hypothetical protein CHELA1G2_14792 [Hyphomicrobiales bacterium]|nr:hypothetical protein CHELA1G2_14792 [Hyphomicrobiales bacterium]
MCFSAFTPAAMSGMLVRLVDEAQGERLETGGELGVDPVGADHGGSFSRSGSHVRSPRTGRGEAASDSGCVCRPPPPSP